MDTYQNTNSLSLTHPHPHTLSVYRWYKEEYSDCEEKSKEVGVEDERETVDKWDTCPAHQDLHTERGREGDILEVFSLEELAR